MATLLFFGKLTDIVGKSVDRRDLPENVRDTQSLRTWLDAELGSGETLLDKSIRIAINNEIADEPAAIHQADEIAFMPPVGGG